MATPEQLWPACQAAALWLLLSSLASMPGGGTVATAEQLWPACQEAALWLLLSSSGQHARRRHCGYCSAALACMPGGGTVATAEQL